MELINTNKDIWRKNLRNVNGNFIKSNEEFWTGPKPGSNVPGMCKDGSITSLPLLNLATCGRNEILKYFENTWFITEVLFSSFKNEEAFYRPPYHSLRHPMIFYYAHPATLYINKLRVAELIDHPINAEYEILFETGVDEMSWDDMSKNEMEWPSIDEVREYRRGVYNLVHDIIKFHPGFDHLPIKWDDELWSVIMGIEHERIHIETSSVLIRELPLELVTKPDQWPKYHPKLLDNVLQPQQDIQGAHLEIEFIEIPCGDIVIGKAKDWPSFGWDNEYGHRKFTFDKFYVSSTLTTNGQYLEFVRDQGYLEQSYWTEEGWKWKTFRNIKWPTFWIPIGPAGFHEYKLRLIFEIIDLPMDVPAIVNKHEADAFCNWLSKKHNLDKNLNYRILTEIEHQRIQDLTKKDTKGRNAEDFAMMYSGEQMKEYYNTSLAYGAESPVKSLKPNKKGIYDVNGNVWQWCEDFFACLPENIGVHPMYDDFSVPCYDGEHNIIAGGSFMSSGNPASNFSRYHFRPHFFQHAGFRIVKPTTTNTILTHIDSPPPHVGNWNPISSKMNNRYNLNIVRELLLSEFPNDIIPKMASFNIPFDSFVHSFVSEIISISKQLNLDLKSVLNIGSSVGGLCFKMAKHVKKVIGIEMDADLIKIANKIKTDKFIYTEFPEELDVIKNIKIAPEVEFDKVEFKRMDPCAMAPDIGVYDCVMVSHILERIASPKALLVRMGGPRGIVKKGGLLAIACTGDWDPKVVPKQLWLSAKYNDNDKHEKIELEKSLKKILGTDFVKVSEKDIPLFIPITFRKYILKVSNVSLWKRN